MKDRCLVAIHWRCFGPYHLTRLNAAYEYSQQKGFNVTGLEIAATENTYLWRQEIEPTPFARYTVFPGQVYETISPVKIWQNTWQTLSRIQPDAVAIAGYRTVDAQAILSWCVAHGKKAILMTDSKEDDTPRSWHKELFKRLIIKQYATALCAGTPHKTYLIKLGLPAERIFTGYDVIDNTYFWHSANYVRQNSLSYRYLPGLYTGRPFFLVSGRFIPWVKNLDGLLRAYAQYHEKAQTPWHLVILGDGEEKQNLLNLTEQLGLSDEVTFAGFRQIDELGAYYGLASVFIHPSNKDTWGLVVNEAMAAGLPVLVSKACGCAYDLIRDGQNGFIFDPQDINSLVNLMLKVSSSEIDLSKMGQHSREIIANWGPDRFARELGEALNAAFGSVI